MPGKVFINYRRSDTEAWADRLYERLTAQLPGAEIIMDIGACAKLSDEGWGRGDRPVILVSWEEAKGYVTWQHPARTSLGAVA